MITKIPVKNNQKIPLIILLGRLSKNNKYGVRTREVIIGKIKVSVQPNLYPSNIEPKTNKIKVKAINSFRRYFNLFWIR
jgi:hypothetical protein